MSDIYQGEVIELTSSDLVVLEQELNPSDDFQSLIIARSSFSEPIDKYEDDLHSDWLEELEARWESDYSPRPLTEQEEEEWLQYENERLESAIEETENQLL